MIRRRANGRPELTARGKIAVFYAVAVGTLLVLGAGAFVASRLVAREEALSDAERMTTRLANLVVAPLLRPALDGDAERLEELHRTVFNRMSDGYLTEVTVWAVDGRVVFSDDESLTGTQEPLPEEAAAAIRSGTIYAAFEDQPEVPTEYNSGSNPGFVEVYVPLELAPGEVYAFEAYYDYGRVNEIANSLLRQILPLAFVPLVLLQLIQVPIAASLARRVRQQEADRADLLELALTLSERERVRIAADLHDGPIQELAGVGYALGTLVPALPDGHRPLADRVGATLHHAVDSLRRMMVDIYPPDLTTNGLAETIDGLATPLREEGLEVDVMDRGLPELAPHTITAMYRVARESLLNVASHAQAHRVDIELSTEHVGTLTDARRRNPGSSTEPLPPVARMVIADDGVGFAEGDLDRRSDGHLGLRLLHDRVQSMGGVLTVEAPASGGTRVTLLLPVTAATPSEAVAAQFPA
jgi:two-component system NarL family sensor kinase